MPTKKRARRKRAARQLAQPRTQVKEVQLEGVPAPVVVHAPVAAVAVRSRARDRAGALVAQRAFPLVVLAALYVLSVVVYAILSRDAFPDLFPDEMFYGKLAQNLAWGHGLSWRGSNEGLPPLWPIVQSLAWHSGSVPQAYDVAKVLSAVVISTTIVPVWLLGRELVGARRALIPAALSLTGAWMLVSEFVGSENLAYPLATASLGCTVMAARDPRLRWIGYSLGFALLATLTRTQMLALPVILVLVLVLDVLRQSRGSRRARFDARPRALWAALTGTVVVGVLAFVLKPGLTNYDVLAHHVSLGDAAATSGRHAVSAIVLFAFIPVAAVLALALRRENWRDDTSGPLLVTCVASILVIFPIAGRFEAWASLGTPIDRYSMYLAPLFLLGLVVASTRISRAHALIAAVGTSALLFATPDVRNFIEQPATYGTHERLSAISPFFSDHPALGLALAGLAITAAGLIPLSARARPARGLAIAVGLVFGVMLAQAWTSRAHELDILHKGRYAAGPAQLDWVDRAAHGDVAILSVGKAQPWRPNLDLYTEFFNRRIQWIYSTLPVQSQACDVDLKRGGEIRRGTGYCRTFPSYWLVVEGPYKTRLLGQRVVATSANHGTLVKVPAGPPKIFSIVAPACYGQQCQGVVQVGVYLREPARVAMTFSPPAADYHIQTGDRVQTLRQGRPTTLRFQLPAGDESVSLPVDWRSPDGAPQLKSVYVQTQGKITRIY